MITKQTTPRYLRLDNEVWKKVEECARDERRPLSNMVERIILDWIRLKNQESMLDSVCRRMSDEGTIP